MKRFTIFGSRLYFWLLLPWMLGGLFFFPYLAYYEISVNEMFGFVVGLILFLWCLFLLLASVMPQRFSWLIYLITGSISLGYFWYFYDSYFVHGESILRNPDAAHGLELYGIHFLIFTAVGIRTLIRQKRKMMVPNAALRPITENAISSARGPTPRAGDGSAFGR